MFHPDVSQLHRTLWWTTAKGRPLPEPIDDDIDADMVVVGAGFTGLTAALHLATQGCKVVVLEAGQLGSGASGLNAGFVVPNFAKADPAAVIARLGEVRGRRLLTAVGVGADQVFDTIRREEIQCDAEQVGWMHVAHRPEAADMLRRRAQDWQALGRPVSFLEPAEARARTGARLCHGAFLDPSGGMLNPLGYLYGLARAATKAGARIYEKVRVDTAVREGARWRVGLGERSIRSRQVLICTNAFTDGVAAQLGRNVVPLHVYQIATEPLPSEVARQIAPLRNPVADTRANLFTYRLDAEDRLISGGMAVLPFRAEARMSREIVERLRTELRLPTTPGVDFVWRGVAAMTVDFLPHLYEIEEGMLGAIGCNGRGIALTAVVGETLARVALGLSIEDSPIPRARAFSIPFGWLAAAAPSFAVAHARWIDWRQRDYLPPQD